MELSDSIHSFQKTQIIIQNNKELEEASFLLVSAVNVHIYSPPPQGLFLAFVEMLYKKINSLPKWHFYILYLPFILAMSKILCLEGDTLSSGISSTCSPNHLQQLAEIQDIANDDKKQTQFCCKRLLDLCLLSTNLHSKPWILKA